MIKRILTISPHADDMELGCGGYVAKEIANGAKVLNAVVTTGNIYHPRQGRTVDSYTRVTELNKSMEILGCESAPVMFVGYDTVLDTVPIKDIVSKIELWVKEFMPNEVLIPLPSAHQDHDITYRACLAALRPSVLPHNINLIAAYEYPASGWGDCTFLDGGKSGMYVDITDYLPKKIEALRCYESQIKSDKHCFSVEAATSLAKLRGIESGMEYAEMFRIMRKVVRN